MNASGSTSYSGVVAILEAAIGGPEVEIGVHKAFWRGATRDEFVAKRIRGLEVVTVGDGSGSTIIKALKGLAPFGVDLPDPPDGAEFSRMPAGLPAVAESDISYIERWIDEGCPTEAQQREDGQMSHSWKATGVPKASSRTDDIWFESETTGWAVNSNGQIIHTSDSGRTWSIQWQGKAYLRCIGFADPQHGWCGTLTKVRRLLRTEDRGATWKEVTNLPELAPSAVCGISVVNARVVYAAGTNFPERPARMMKTTDGGAHWTGWEMSPWADLLIDCYFLDEMRGWVVGGKSKSAPATRANVKPVVLFTDDGGATWTNRAEAILDTCALGEWGWKIFFLDDRVGFVSLESFEVGAILKTVDGGITWERLPINDEQRNANLEGVGFIDEQTGWVGGWGDADFERQGSSVTTDGGKNWTDANFIGKGINRFRFFGKPVRVGYASGETVYRYSSDAPAVLGLDGAAEAPRILVAQISSEGVRLPLSPAWKSRKISFEVWSRFGAEIADVEEATVVGDRESFFLWDLRNRRGELVAPGHYIIRAHDGVSVESLILRLR